MEPVTGPNPTKIKEMFGKIARGYDLANSVLSAGIHSKWKQELVDQSEVKHGDYALDCATGTGDLAILLKKAVGNAGHVRGTDFCEEMLALAPQKAREKDLLIMFELADVTRLPYAEDSYDVVTIAFGIRNVGDPAKAISEMQRVLRRGGRLMILEFGQPESKNLPSQVFSKVYRFYSNFVLPRVGSILTGGEKSAYDYLNESAKAFPCRGKFLDFCKASAPFEKAEFTELSHGIAYLYKFVK